MTTPADEGARAAARDNELASLEKLERHLNEAGRARLAELREAATPAPRFSSDYVRRHAEDVAAALNETFDILTGGLPAPDEDPSPADPPGPAAALDDLRRFLRVLGEDPVDRMLAAGLGDLIEVVEDQRAEAKRIERELHCRITARAQVADCQDAELAGRIDHVSRKLDETRELLDDTRAELFAATERNHAAAVEAWNAEPGP